MAVPYMTMAQIEKEYPNQWVLINNPTTRRRSMEITGGYVELHCADRAEFIRRVGEWEGTRGVRAAIQYVGKFPEEEDDLIPVEQESSRQ